MASLNDISNVNISRKTLGVSRGVFGVPMIVAPLLTFPERVRTYTSYPAAAQDNLPTNVLSALSAYFNQNPRPNVVKLCRRAVLKAVINVSAVTALATYSFKVNSETYSYTADGTPTAAEIVTGLALAVTSDTDEVITATAVGNTLEIAWISTVGSVSLVSGLSWGTISPLAASTAVADDLNAIKAADSALRGLVMAERVKQTQLDAAAWAESNQRQFVTATDESGVLVQGTTTDLFSLLKASNYFYTDPIYHAAAATEYPDAAWLGRVYTIAPGSETWANKSLAGITPSNITDTEKAVILSKNGNVVEKYSENITLINPGTAASGEWIDVVRFRDWLADTIRANMAQMTINRDKIPYTDAGIQLCVNNLRKSLQEGQNAGGIAPDELDAQGNSVPGFVITYPLAADVSPTIKQTRVVYLSFVARLAGAVHLTEITGSLAYEI